MDERTNDIQSHITDSKELTQARRIRSLLERRARVIDSLEAISMARTKKGQAESETRLVFVSHLRSLIIDLYPLLLQSQKITLHDEAGSESDGESNALLGTFTVDPPESVPTDSMDPKLKAGESPPSPKRFKVKDISWFTERTFPMSVTWEVPYSGKRGTQEVTKEVVPPIPLCLRAMKQTMQYMAELKIDIEAHEDKGTFGFDYDEIDEELPDEETPNHE